MRKVRLPEKIAASLSQGDATRAGDVQVLRISVPGGVRSVHQRRFKPHLNRASSSPVQSGSR